MGSPRSRSGSPLSLRSNSSGYASSETSHASGGANRTSSGSRMGPNAAHAEQASAAPAMSPSSSSCSDSDPATTWRPFSAPIGLATRQHRRRHSKSSVVDGDALCADGSQASRSPSVGGGYASSSSSRSRGSIRHSSNLKSKTSLRLRGHGNSCWIAQISKYVTGYQRLLAALTVG